MVKIPIEDLGYMAGIFDSEGCAFIGQYKKRGSFMPGLTIQMCDKEPLESFKLYFGAKIGETRIEKNKSELYKWHIRGKKIIPIAQKLLPHLHIERKQHAMRCALKYAETLRNYRRNYLSSTLVSVRQQLWEQCKQLNAGSNRQVSLEYNHMMPTQKELHYMAGMWDGDGSACILKQREGFGETKPSLVIEMCDTEALVLFKSCFGGTLRKSGRHHKPQHSQSYRWEMTGKNIIPVAELLLPLLRIPRKAKAIACVMECAKLTSLLGRARHGVPYHILQEREELRQKCILLNKRGSEKMDADAIKINITPASQLSLW